MLYTNEIPQPMALTLGGMAQRTISATKRYRGYIHQVMLQAAPEQELALWLPTLSRLSQDPGWILWVAPPFSVNQAVMVNHGVSPQRILTIAPQHPDQAFSLVRTALQCTHYSAVFWWYPNLSEQQIQTLKQAAQAGQSVGVLMHQHASETSTH